MKIHSFGLSDEDEKRFQKILEQEPGKTASAIIRRRVLGRRSKHGVVGVLADLGFLSQVSNLLDCLNDNLKRGEPVQAEVEELKKLISTKISQSL